MWERRTPARPELFHGAKAFHNLRSHRKRIGDRAQSPSLVRCGLVGDRHAIRRPAFRIEYGPAADANQVPIERRDRFAGTRGPPAISDFMGKRFDVIRSDERRPQQFPAVERVGAFGDGPGVVRVSGLLDNLRRVDRTTKKNGAVSQPVLSGQRAKEKPVIERGKFVGNDVGHDEQETDGI